MVEVPDDAQHNVTESMEIDDIIKPEPITQDVLPEPECHKFLWHDDGTAVIITVSTLFRVHQNILCENSSVLKALVVLSQAAHPTSDEVDDTQPKSQKDPCYIHLNDDPDDIEQLLLSLYDPKYEPHVSVLLTFLGSP